MYLQKNVLLSSSNPSHMCSGSEFYKSQSYYESLCALPKGDIKTDLMVKPDGEREAERERKIERRVRKGKRNERLTVLHYTHHTISHTAAAVRYWDNTRFHSTYYEQK